MQSKHELLRQLSGIVLHNGSVRCTVNDNITDADEIASVVALPVEETEADWQSVSSLRMRNRYITRGELGFIRMGACKLELIGLRITINPSKEERIAQCKSM